MDLISYYKKAAVFLTMTAALCFCGNAEKLVILHTNDTHSTIEPLPDGTGGVLQRKAVIDSVRGAEKNVILVDAGDVVQGTLFFKYFHGDVEYPLMDMMGYDIRVLGNHEFDNGMEELASRYRETKGTPVSANYDFSGTLLEGIFKPYEIKEVGGKKIGFFGINIDPTSIISEKNIDVNFLEIIPTANETARKLKHELGCDLVVAVTHIGYEKTNDKTSDIELAQLSEDIDIIIGGHSHTMIDPLHPEVKPSLIPNIKGTPVRVVQTGKQGKYLGKITVDLDKLGEGSGADWEYELIPVTDRFPAETFSSEIIEFLAPYKEKVDSVNNIPVAYSVYDLKNERLGGMANMTADFGKWYTSHIADSLRALNKDFPAVDLSVMNVGGIRHPMPKGIVTEGQIMSTYPFSNKIVIIGIKGKDIIEAMRIAAIKGGEAVSENIRVVTNEDGDLIRVVIDGEEMDPEKEYIVGTIDYVAEGNDDLRSFANHRKLWESEDELCVPVLEWFRQQTALGLPIMPDLNPRFVVKTDNLLSQ